MKIDKNKLEQLLSANWTKFIDSRLLLKKINTLAKEKLDLNSPVNSMVISRFELAPQGFTIWVEFTGSSVSGTSEFILRGDGELIHNHTIKG